MQKLLFILVTFIGVQYSSAQTAEDSVKAAVTQMFTAMRNSDSVSLVNLFSETAVLQTINRNKEGKIIVRSENVSGFGANISKLPKGDADERITFGAVHIDGPMASVWTPYEFYFKGNFSHCGVNSFQLVRINGEWKIQYIIDTRRKDGCK